MKVGDRVTMIYDNRKTGTIIEDNTSQRDRGFCVSYDDGSSGEWLEDQLELIQNSSKNNIKKESDLEIVKNILNSHGFTERGFFPPEKGVIEELSKDNVNSPSHYTQGKIQPIEYIEDQQLGFNLGNVVKYISRHGKKNGLEDLKKAKWYLEREIANMEKNNAKN